MSLEITILGNKVEEKTACPKCVANGGDTSGDNLAVYNDGHKYCFACGYYEKGDKSYMTEVKDENVQAEFTAYTGKAEALPHRRINLETVKKFGYQTSSTMDRHIEIENYFGFDGMLQAQKIRNVKSKDFHWVGNTKNVQLYGQHLWEKGGPRILVTEGAIDALTMSQMFDNKYPVVSIPSGTQGAVKSVKENYEFLASFETIVICFDMDDPGKKAAREVAEILPPGKVKIMELPRKDPNEMLMANEGKQLMQSYWNAKTHSPDSILHVSQVTGDNNTPAALYEFPWESLTNFMVGQDAGRLYLWTSATGHGKSSIIREILIHHLETGNPTGCIFLEESPESTVDDLISLKLAKPVRKIMGQRQLNSLRKQFNKDTVDLGVADNLTEEEYTAAKKEVGEYPLYIYDHIGNANIENVMSRLEYMAVGLGCKVLIVDHITLLGNMLLSQQDNYGNSERLILDDVMKQLRALVERTGCIVHVISHIKKTDKNVDEGDRINLNDLRGSGSLAQIADYVFALERNRQHTDPNIANTTCIRVLKNRKTGQCGLGTALYYNKQTSRLQEIEFTQTPEGEVLYNYASIGI
jgi:twinkle protein